MQTLTDDSTSANLSPIEFLTYHILIRKLLELSDKGLIVLGSARDQLIRLRGFCNYLTIGQKNTINLIIIKCLNRSSKEELFKIVDSDFNPEYIDQNRKTRQRKKSFRALVEVKDLDMIS